MWDRLPACQSSKDRLEAYPTVVSPRLNHFFESKIFDQANAHAIAAEPRLGMTIEIMNNQTAHKIEVSDQQNEPLDFSDCIKVAGLILDDFGVDKSEISIALVDDAAIRELNRQYLNHDYETDVISFVLEESDTSLTGTIARQHRNGQTYGCRNWCADRT